MKKKWKEKTKTGNSKVEAIYSENLRAKLFCCLLKLDFQQLIC